MEQDFLLQFRPPFREREGSAELWDGIRKKWVAATPEELVRQKMVAWLVCHALVPMSRISIERSVRGLPGRWDIAVYNTHGNPILLAECKSESGNTASESIFQVARYAQALPTVNWLWVSNGSWLYWLHRDTPQVPWQHSNERAFLLYSKKTF